MKMPTGAEFPPVDRVRQTVDGSRSEASPKQTAVRSQATNEPADSGNGHCQNTDRQQVVSQCVVEITEMLSTEQF